MNKIINSFWVVFALLVFSLTTNAQDNRTLTTKIADLLAQMPSNNLQQRDKLAEELISLGTAGFQQLADQITPSGKGDNTAAVFAINGLTRYASQPGKETQRAFSETCFIQALEKAKETEVKAFFLRQLKLIGSDKAVVAAAGYMNSNDLCEPATFVLTSVNSEAAKNELLKALPKADGKCLITIIRALGELQVKAANGEILKNITSDNLNLKKASLAAVASIAAAESYQPLLAAAQNAGFVYEASNASSEFLSYSQHLGEMGNLELCGKACLEIANLCKAPAQLHFKSSALAIYNQYFEKEAQPLLLKAFDNNDKAFRFSVLNLVEKSKLASTKVWISKATKAQPEQKAEIITMFGKKGDLSVLDFIKKQFAAKEAVVSEAAISAFARLKGKEAITDLTTLLSQGIEPAYTAKRLMSLVDEKSLDQIAAIMETAPEISKSEIITLIGAKSGKRYFDQVYNYTSSANPTIKYAAIGSMRNTGSPKDIDRLLKLLYSTDEPEQIKAIQDGLVNAASEIQGEKDQTTPLMAQLPNVSKKGRILEVLSRLGGPQALKAVSEFISSSDQAERDAAFNGLISWKDQAASSTLYEICKTATGEKLSKAISGFVRQIKGSFKITGKRNRYD